MNKDKHFNIHIHTYQYEHNSNIISSDAIIEHDINLTSLHKSPGTMHKLQLDEEKKWNDKKRKRDRRI